MKLKTQEKLSVAFGHILPESLLKKLADFESTSIPPATEKSLLSKAMSLQLSDFAGIREFSNMYSDFVRGMMNRKIFGKKLLEIENSLRKGDVDGVTKLLQTSRYILSKIVDKSNKIVFVEEIKTVDSIVDVCMHTKTDINTVCKALALDGILEDYLIENTVV